VITREKNIVLWLIALIVFASSGCQKNSSNPSNSNPNAFPDAADSLVERTPPFATKEPEKYSALIVFVSNLSANPADKLEQTTFVARDGTNRRIDFEIGKNAISHLQNGDNKQFVLLFSRKVYAEVTTSNEKLLKNQPAEFSLNYLLYTKPIGANFEQIGPEEVLGRQTTKYRIDYGTVREAAEARTETFVWADEKLGLPIKTEIIAIENNSPSGARSVVELREIKTDVDSKVFEIPKDYRRISYQEMRQILQQK
jgi:hypothetical protein